MLKVITVTDHPEHAQTLLRSLEKHGWEYAVLETEWRGFGTKLIAVYEYLKTHPEVTEFIFCDAFDVVVLGGDTEFKDKLWGGDIMVVSCEKGLWPPSVKPFRNDYADFEHGFNFPNSGLYYAKSHVFIELFEYYPPFYEIDDQFWMNVCFLLQPKLFGNIRLDYAQSLFNSHSFIGEGEYGYENNRVQINGEAPLWIHFNGKTVDEKFNELIKL